MLTFVLTYPEMRRALKFHPHMQTIPNHASTGSRHNQRVQLIRSGIGQRLNLSARDTRRFHQHITAFRLRFAGQMIDNIGLYLPLIHI